MSLQLLAISATLLHLRALQKDSCHDYEEQETGKETDNVHDQKALNWPIVVLIYAQADQKDAVKQPD